MDELSKVIIVEGKQDKKKIKRVLEDEALFYVHSEHLVYMR